MSHATASVTVAGVERIKTRSVASMDMGSAKMRRLMHRLNADEQSSAVVDLARSQDQKADAAIAVQGLQILLDVLIADRCRFAADINHRPQ